jgi:hypothetical protein
MGRGSRTRWDALGMPWMAAALAESECRYQNEIDQAALKSAYTDHPGRPLMKKFANHIANARLYWMSRTTASVAADLASRDMPDVTFQEVIATSDLPPVGLLLWPKPLAVFPWRNEEMRLAREDPLSVTWDGLAWIYDESRITTYLLSQMSEQRKRGLLSDMRPKSSPGQVIRFDEHDLATVVDRDSGVLDIVSPLDDPEMRVSPPTLLATVVSLLALIGQQRVVVQTTVTSMDSSSKRSVGTARKDVTMLDILRPPGVTGVTGNRDSDDRAFRRWFVRGHYRHQLYGPGNALRKVIYISLHTAGHPDAPEPTGAPPPRVSGLYGKKFKRP